MFPSRITSRSRSALSYVDLENLRRMSQSHPPNHNNIATSKTQEAHEANLKETSLSSTQTAAELKTVSLGRRVGSPGRGEDVEENEIATVEAFDAQAEEADTVEKITEGQPEVVDSNCTWPVP